MKLFFTILLFSTVFWACSDEVFSVQDEDFYSEETVDAEKDVELYSGASSSSSSRKNLSSSDKAKSSSAVSSSSSSRKNLSSSGKATSSSAVSSSSSSRKNLSSSDKATSSSSVSISFFSETNLSAALAVVDFSSSSDRVSQLFSFDDSEYPYAGLPRFIIETDGGNGVNDRTELSAKLQVWGESDPQGAPMNLTIRGRGNTSWTHMPKHSFKLEFEKKQALLDLPENKDWALIANYADKTLMKNFISYY